MITPWDELFNFGVTLVTKEHVYTAPTGMTRTNPLQLIRQNMNEQGFVCTTLLSATWRDVCKWYLALTSLLAPMQHKL